MKKLFLAQENYPLFFLFIQELQKNVNQLVKNFSNLYLVEPLGYHEFNFLVENSKGVLTDSGGITEETTVLNVPCLTLRENTERPETVEIGTNELVGTDPKSIKYALDKLFQVIGKGS